MKLTIDIKDSFEELTIVEANNSIEVQCSGLECWRCGANGKMSMHHTLPKHLRPKKNVVVPVCFPCHEEINRADLTGIKSFGYKIFKSAKELSLMIRRWTERSDAIVKREQDVRREFKK